MDLVRSDSENSCTRSADGEGARGSSSTLSNILSSIIVVRALRKDHHTKVLILAEPNVQNECFLTCVAICSCEMKIHVSLMNGSRYLSPINCTCNYCQDIRSIVSIILA